MIAYIDSSIVLRLVLGEPGGLAEWPEILQGVTSALAEVETLRTLDRISLRSELDPADLAARREAAFQLLEGLEIVEITRGVLARASQPLPTPLGTLDAIHLSSALMWREQSGAALTFATHDQALGLAARACGLTVIGA